MPEFREQRLFFVDRATSNDKLIDAIVAELSTINRNLQTMKEELVQLSLNSTSTGAAQSHWSVYTVAVYKQ